MKNPDDEVTFIEVPAELKRGREVIKKKYKISEGIFIVFTGKAASGSYSDYISLEITVNTTEAIYLLIPQTRSYVNVSRDRKGITSGGWPDLRSSGRGYIDECLRRKLTELNFNVLEVTLICEELIAEVNDLVYSYIDRNKKHEEIEREKWHKARAAQKIETDDKE